MFSPFPELFPGGLTLAGQLLQGAPASCPIYRAWLLPNEKLDRYKAAYVYISSITSAIDVSGLDLMDRGVKGLVEGPAGVEGPAWVEGPA